MASRKKISIITLSLLILALNINSVFATQLPDPIIKFIKSTFPKAEIRFDGLVELPDGTKYVPVLPAMYAKVDNPTNIVQTIPAKSSFSLKPELILFSNNLSLLKMLKTQDGYTFTQNNNVPFAVKFGILPQDLVVPKNLVIPDEFKIILGNLKITTSDKPQVILKVNNNKNTKLTDKIKPANIVKTGVNTAKVGANMAKVTVSAAKAGMVVAKDVISSPLENFDNKVFYLTNIHSTQLSVVSARTGKTIKLIDISSVPSGMLMTEDEKYIITSNISTESVSIIDVKNNKLLKNIKVGKLPDSIVILSGTNKAYVANKFSSNISVIDLVKLTKEKDIPVTGAPVKLVSSEDKTSLFYLDEQTGKIYNIKLSTPTKIEPVTDGINISKIYQFKNYLAVLSRTENTLKIFDLASGKYINTVIVSKKPVDIIIQEKLGKIYVLSGGTNSIDVIDLEKYEIVNKIQFKGKAFPIKMNLYESGNKAMVITADSYEMPIIDLKDDKVIEYFPVSNPVNSLIIKD